MTTQNSDVMANIDALPPVLVGGGGILKIQTFTFTQVGAGGGAGDVIRLWRVPSGARLLVGRCTVANSAYGGAVLLNFGWEAYQNPDGTVIAASPTGLVTGLSVVAASPAMRTITGGSAVATYFKQFDGPAVLIATSSGGAIPAGATLIGELAYL